MRKKKNLAVSLLVAFSLWTWAVCTVDVQPVGPLDSTVGFARLNGFVHRLTGVHLWLYNLTDWLSLIPFALVGAFGILGLAQWIRRKSLLRVDRSLLTLGGFYLAVLAFYALFEIWVINYRPVLIEGVLEASYPSSTTLLVLCVMSTVQMQLRRRLRPGALRRMVCTMLPCFTAFMVLARLLSGVHWLTDILGGAVLSAALVTAYGAVLRSE